jgi:proteasome lid subunit RPN8/RPN11
LNSAAPLLLAEPIRAAILAHADNCLPDECCGLIASDETGAVRFAYPLTNANPSPVTFTLDPQEHYGAMRHAENQGWEIAGVFHSHPAGAAIPSAIDVAMALDPDWVHLILAGGEIGAFRIRGGSVESIEVWLVGERPG